MTITRTPTRCAGCGQHQGRAHLARCPYTKFTWRATWN